MYRCVARSANAEIAPLLDLPAALRERGDLRRLHVEPAASSARAQLAPQPGLDPRAAVAIGGGGVLLRSPDGAVG